MEEDRNEEIEEERNEDLEEDRDEDEERVITMELHFFDPKDSFNFFKNFNFFVRDKRFLLKCGDI